MQELGFHRKYRPTKLSNYIGNAKLKKSVKLMLSQEILPQVILMHGPAGTGKTTMARLLAKEYLCTNRVNNEACDECYNCKLVDTFITTGQNKGLYNLQEVDITDSNKKQDIDALLEDMSQPSFDGNWKIYILDEVHTLSNAAQNRLLKTLEEPPQNVLIILCTTNPEKLLETVLTRCQYKFQVTKPTREELVALLIAVCKAEKIDYEEKALSLIAVRSGFVPRRALIELENVIRETGSVKYSDTAALLGAIIDNYYFNFLKFFMDGSIDILRYVSFLAEIKEKFDLVSFIQGFLEFLTRGVYVLNGVKVSGLDAEDLKVYTKLFGKFRPNEIIFILDYFINLANLKEDVIDIKLLLLGYTGLRKYSGSDDTKQKESISEAAPTASQEKSAGVEALLVSKEMTEDEINGAVQQLTKPVSLDQGLQFLNAFTVSK